MLLKQNPFRMGMVLFLLYTLILVSCTSKSDEEDSTSKKPANVAPVTPLFSTDAGAGFFDAPFPVAHMQRENGTLHYSILPNPDQNYMVDHYIDLADRKTQGFSRIGVIYIPFDGAIDTTNLPQDEFESLADDTNVFLVNIEASSPRYKERYPFYSAWQAKPTKYLPGNLLKILPYQGRPLAPNTMHAAVVVKTLGGKDGGELLAAPEIEAMAKGAVPDGKHGQIDADSFQYLWNYCDAVGIDRDQIATAAVFRTGDFVTEMKALRDACSEMDDPVAYDLKVLSDYDTFYVIEGKMGMPIWQDGERTYFAGGGEIHFLDGEPVHQWDEEIRFAVSVPKAPMPDAGYPLLFYANGQGGTYTQVFDRGGIGEDANKPGTGPGLQLAHRGIACIDIEAATVGPRHPTGSYSGFEFFNFWNLIAFRDNVRQAASEFTMLIKMAKNLSIPASLVPEADTGGADVTFDSGNYFFWGHSTGASIGDLVMAVEPEFRAGMVSGAGVSWAYNLVLKQKPFPLRPVFKVLAGSDEIDAYHPLALLFQNLCDPIEAAYYAEHWLHDPIVDNRPFDAMIIMGIVDLYFPPLMIDGLVVASGMDLAGEVVYEETLDALEFSGREALPLPVSGNIEGRTAVTIQYETPEDVDGHYAPFYLDTAKYQYGCFFESLAKTGTATVPVAGENPFGDCGF